MPYFLLYETVYTTTTLLFYLYFIYLLFYRQFYHQSLSAWPATARRYPYLGAGGQERRGFGDHDQRRGK